MLKAAKRACLGVAGEQANLVFVRLFFNVLALHAQVVQVLLALILVQCSHCFLFRIRQSNDDKAIKYDTSVASMLFRPY